MSFIEVALYDWDCDAVAIGPPPKGGAPTVLYRGKIPILSIRSNDPNNRYLLRSRDGLARSTKYDNTNNKYTDVWDGKWRMSFMVTNCINDAPPLAIKLMEVFRDIEKKVEAAFEKTPNDALSYTWITEKNRYGVEKRVDIDRSKGCYFNVKVGYDAPKDAPKIRIDGKDEPAFDYRYPKGQFYDVTRAKDSMRIENPDTECGIGMNAIPKVMIGLYNIQNSIHITKTIMQCYYEPNTSDDGFVDHDLIDALRNNIDITD